MTPVRSTLLIQAHIAARTGMALSGTQRKRLDERLAVLQGSLSEQQYLLHLQSPSGAADLSTLISVVAVHKTDLFRDEVQLQDFRAHVLEPLVAKSLGRPLRVWSAGCATGEEVATLLIMLDEARADQGSTVLGTDISEAALNRARTLSFPGEQVRRLPGVLRERYFMPDGSRAILIPELRERAIFQHHNLMEAPYPSAAGSEGFDIIFCRNVLIYFTPEAFERVVRSLAERLAPGGTLILSAAEPLLHAPPSLRIIRSEHAFFYVRTPDVPAPPAFRSSGMGGLPGELPGLERRRDAGQGGTAQPPPPDWSRETGNPMGAPPASGSEPRRESGRFASVGVGSEPRRDSGRVASVGGGAELRRDSGRFASVASGSGSEAQPRDSGRFPSVGGGAEAQPRDSGRFPSVGGGAETRRDSGRFPSVGAGPELRRDSGRFPSVGGGTELRRDSGRFPSVGAAPAPGASPSSGQFPTVRPSEPQERQEEQLLFAEADHLFTQVLEGAAESDSQTEDSLRRCLALDPDLSAARYLLGMLLELRESYADAAAEYRKALRSLEEGRARPTPFFLNHARLRVACEKAIVRMEGGGGRPR